MKPQRYLWLHSDTCRCRICASFLGGPVGPEGERHEGWFDEDSLGPPGWHIVGMYTPAVIRTEMPEEASPR